MWGGVRRSLAAATSAFAADVPGAAARAEGALLTFRRWASKKQGGSTSNGRDSNPKFLGLKAGNGQFVLPGSIIVRQRGTRFFPGDGVGMGKDHTIFATVPGTVGFKTDRLRDRKFIFVQQQQAAAALH